jgi:hypothetical protein
VALLEWARAVIDDVVDPPAPSPSPARPAYTKE